MHSWIDYIINEQWIKIIYCTLLHSIWQGVAVAGLAGILMMATKRSPAVFRYNMLLASLLLFVLCVAVTFSAITYYAGEKLATTKFIFETSLPATSTAIIQQQTGKAGTLNLVFTFFNAHADTIVVLWLLVICFKIVQLSIGLYQVSLIKRKQLIPVTASWSTKIKKLSVQMGIMRIVLLAESGIAKVPLTIGYFKPVILVPVGMMASLPIEQVEAILLHELAHIHRKDYMVNIFQSFVEILFFFNPAMWWLSSLLRTERENCCDDIAIANISCKSTYLKALISFEEYHSVVPQYANALTGPGHHLLNRVKRIFHKQNKTMNATEKIVLVSALLVTGLLTVAFTRVKPTIIEPSPVKKEITVIAKDTVPLKKEPGTSAHNTVTINTEWEGKQFRIIMHESTISELYINEVRIVSKQIGKYKEVTDKIIYQTETARLSDEKFRKASKTRAEQTTIQPVEVLEDQLSAAVPAISPDIQKIMPVKPIAADPSRLIQ